MAIWYEKFTLNHVISLRNNNLNQHLGIEFKEIGDDFISATMPVDQRTMQSRGVLHGGASCVLAESLGSIASNLCVNMRKQKAVGLEINANHLRPVSKGSVTGITTPISLGKNIHVWNIEIKNDLDKICCISRLTTAIVSLSDEESASNIELLNEILK
ncbi:MAG: esterase [Gammaproteobacteria bacterium]|nr:esterase [Gammaproteobacteria bacterium]|tara:strand:- start:2399 stop:2872 length:474 start_codon:yes stop_codon:yes gene_type:complete